MQRLSGLRFFIVLFLPALAMIGTARADSGEHGEIESITVLADTRLAVPIAELASQFAHESTVSVSVVFAASAVQQKKIEAGEAADMFFTADKERIEQLKTKGLIDIYSIKTIASENGVRYTAAVVASENMTAARTFLAFLKSDEAKTILRRNNLTPP